MIPDHVYNELRDVNPLNEADKKLFGVGSKNVLPVVEMFTAVLQWKNKTNTQHIYVVTGMSKALLGNPAIDEQHSGVGQGLYCLSWRIPRSLPWYWQDGRSLQNCSQGRCPAFRYQRSKTGSFATDGQNEEIAEKDGICMCTRESRTTH